MQYHKRSKDPKLKGNAGYKNTNSRKIYHIYRNAELLEIYFTWHDYITQCSAGGGKTAIEMLLPLLCNNVNKVQKLYTH